MTVSAISSTSLRQLAKILGVSQPFLSQIRAGKRPLPEALRTKLEALGAYHLLIGDKHGRAGQESRKGIGTWWAALDSNQGPQSYQDCALTN